MSSLLTSLTAVRASHPAPDRRLMDPVRSADSGKGLASAYTLYGCFDVGIGCRRFPMRAVELSNRSLVRPRLPRKVFGGDTGSVTADLVRCVSYRVPLGWWRTRDPIQHHATHGHGLLSHAHSGVVGPICVKRPQNAAVRFPRSRPVNNRLNESSWVTVASRTAAEGIAMPLPTVVVGHTESTHPDPDGTTAILDDARIVGHVASPHVGSGRFTHCTYGGYGGARRTTAQACPVCGYQVEVAVETVNPRKLAEVTS